MLDAIQNQLVYTVSCMSHFGIVFILILLGWWIYDLTTPYKFSKELTQKDNPGVGVMLAGYFLASALALGGAAFGAGLDLNMDSVVGLGVSGVLVLVLLRLSALIMDRLILSKFKVTDEIVKEQNVGVAFAAAGAYLATGLVLNGALTGQSESLAMGLRDITIYWAIGQLILVIGGIVFQVMTKYDMHTCLKEKNVAVGISFGGFLMALGILTRTSIAGAGSDLLVEIGGIIGTMIVGFPMLLAARVVSDKVLMPNAPISEEVGEQRNTAAAGIAFGVFVSVAFLISYVLTNVQ